VYTATEDSSDAFITACGLLLATQDSASDVDGTAMAPGSARSSTEAPGSGSGSLGLEAGRPLPYMDSYAGARHTLTVHPALCDG
jgi:hypothetical protein